MCGGLSASIECFAHVNPPLDKADGNGFRL